MKYAKKTVVALVLAVALMLCTMTGALALEIYGNGTGDIYIDINSTPYSDAWDPQWGNPYGPYGCTWFAASRIEQLTGINLGGIIYGADQWYNTVYARYGFPRSSTLNTAYKCVICWNAPHMAIFEGFDSQGRLVVSEGGVTSYPNNGYCHIRTFNSESELLYKNSGYLGVIVLPVPAIRGGATLDVNGQLDGVNLGTTQNFGTFDMYVGGTKVAEDAYDYYNQSLQVGTSYKIDDIRPLSGHTYDGAIGDLEGTVGQGGTDVRLIFNSYATLDVEGLLDGAAASDTADYGTFDVYINGELEKAQATDYTGDWPLGTTYEIRNIQAVNNKYYNGPVTGDIAGTLGKGLNTVTLSFSTVEEAGTEWREADELPGYIDPLTVDVEYNNYYQQTAQTSPGEEWTQVPDSGVMTYVNDGDVYNSAFPLTTSDTCVCVGSLYYHYCGASVGNRVNFAYTDQYNTYHEASPASSFDITGQWTDDDDPRYVACQLTWNNGQWAGGLATCYDGRSAIWYPLYQYQNRKAVTNYDWEKESGWGTEIDSAATRTMVRYRLKKYDVTFDANGGMNAPEDQVKYHGIDLALTDAVPEMTGFGFVAWNTQADGKGELYQPGGIYAADEELTLFAQWSPLSRMVLPAGLTTIEEDAFAGIGAVIVEIPEGCESIGMGAFLNCTDLMQVYIPASVSSIAFDAFDGCEKLVVYAPENSTAIRFAKALGIAYEIVE